MSVVPPLSAEPVARSTPSHALPVGTQVGGVEITGLIGEGGFGIVYLAHDPSLQRRVAVKEYMPSSLASRRGDGLEVTVTSERHRETFEAGRKSFVNEARLLARFDHPALVKVYRFWEAHGTAYMMMPYYEGPTLRAALDSRGEPPEEATLRSWLMPLLDALAVIHAASCFHRDIAPDNIILTANGPLLLDFGAARRVIGDMTQALTVVLKPGFAPIEQYGESDRMRQGPWTDLYALGCVVRYAITGRPPMTSVERLMDDALVPLSTVAAGRYSADFLRAIDATLAVRPEERPQDVAQLRAMLGQGASADTDGDGATLPAKPRVNFADLPLSIPERHRKLAAVDTLVPEIKRSRPLLRTLTGVLLALAIVNGVVWMATHRGGARPAAVPAVAVPATSHEPVPVAIRKASPGTPAAESLPAMIKPSSTSSSAAALPVAIAPRVPTPQATHRASSPTASLRPVVTLPTRCSELLLKASLETLTADETAFLKRECK